jgi:hypothetical protein
MDNRIDAHAFLKPSDIIDVASQLSRLLSAPVSYFAAVNDNSVD